MKTSTVASSFIVNPRVGGLRRPFPTSKSPAIAGLAAGTLAMTPNPACRSALWLVAWLLLVLRFAPTAGADTVVGYVIDKDTTWTINHDPYVVNDLTINKGVTLTIKAGVKVKMKAGTTPGTGGVISIYGNLHTYGTGASPVRFTSTAASTSRGQWQRLHFFQGSGGGLNGCVIEYGGQMTDYGAIYAEDCGWLAIRDTVIRRSGGVGIKYVYVDARNARLDRTTITDCAEEPIRLLQSSSPSFGESNNFTGNGVDAIDPGPWSGTRKPNTSDIIWHKAPVPYSWNDQYAVDSTHSLTINRGNIVAPRGTGTLRVDGKLSAYGVRFTSWKEKAGTAAPGDYAGIRFINAKLVVLELCSFKYAATALDFYQSTGKMLVRACDFKHCTYGINVSASKLVYIRNCYFDDITQNALSLGGAGTNPTVSGCEFGDCGRYAVEIDSEARANLGNLATLGTLDDGKNIFTPNVITGGVIYMGNRNNSIRAQNNYWGYTTSAKIATCIHGNANKVIYKPFLEEPPVTANSARAAADPQALSSLSAVRSPSGGASIRYSLAAPATVDVAVKSLTGRRIRTICSDRAVTAGMQVISWDGSTGHGEPVPPGACIVTVTACGEGNARSRASTLLLVR